MYTCTVYLRFKEKYAFIFSPNQKDVDNDLTISKNYFERKFQTQYNVFCVVLFVFMFANFGNML